MLILIITLLISSVNPEVSEPDFEGNVGLCIGPTLLEMRVIQGFFSNTYNKPYPKGFSRCIGPRCIRGNGNSCLGVGILCRISYWSDLYLNHSYLANSSHLATKRRLLSRLTYAMTTVSL
jgi:hypothetical protein